MNNVRTRRTAGKKSVTKLDFAKKLQTRLTNIGLEASVEKSQAVIEEFLDEIRDQIRKGNKVSIKDFGMFYGKRMRSRKVVGGIFPESFDEPFRVPAKTKIGFSSTPTGDESVSRRRSKDM